MKITVTLPPHTSPHRAAVATLASKLEVPTTSRGGEISRRTDNMEQHNGLKVVAFNPRTGTLSTPVVVRFLSGRSRGASVHYCNVFLSNDATHACGTGSAGGYGYHKDSAAMADALSRAGVRGVAELSGRGWNACEEYAAALAVALGFEPVMVVTQ